MPKQQTREPHVTRLATTIDPSIVRGSLGHPFGYSPILAPEEPPIYGPEEPPIPSTPNPDAAQIPSTPDDPLNWDPSAPSTNATVDQSTSTPPGTQMVVMESNAVVAEYEVPNNLYVISSEQKLKKRPNYSTRAKEFLTEVSSVSLFSFDEQIEFYKEAMTIAVHSELSAAHQIQEIHHKIFDTREKFEEFRPELINFLTEQYWIRYQYPCSYEDCLTNNIDVSIQSVVNSYYKYCKQLAKNKCNTIIKETFDSKEKSEETRIRYNDYLLILIILLY